MCEICQDQAKHHMYLPEQVEQREEDAYRKGFDAGRELAAQTSEHWFNLSSAKEQKEAVTRAIRALRHEAESKPCCDQWKRTAGGDGCPKCEPEAESEEKA